MACLLQTLDVRTKPPNEVSPHHLVPNFLALILPVCCSSDLGLDPADKKGYKSMLLLLPSIAGLAGATLRVPNSFMMSVTGGKVFPSPPQAFIQCGRLRIELETAIGYPPLSSVIQP